ncbi:uncharacterized protein LOC143828795 [Paroedura picta]|uniref:uncharacterized protein LOC143828795 n=1 Tax=Paroedura picta TaxID=143630 RepID=UPI00405602E0
MCPCEPHRARRGWFWGREAQMLSFDTCCQASRTACDAGRGLMSHRARARAERGRQMAVTSQPSPGNQAQFCGQLPCPVLTCAMKACFSQHPLQGSPPDTQEGPAEASARGGEEAALHPQRGAGVPPLPGHAMEAGEEAAEVRPAPGAGSSPPPCLGALLEELEAARELQRLHASQRQRDLRSCRGCLRSARALEQQLEELRDRLAAAEARLGLPAPPPRPRPRPARAPRPQRRQQEEEQEEEEEKEEDAAGQGQGEGAAA